MIIMEGQEVVACAFASQHEDQLLLERVGVRPENRRKGVGAGLMVSLILAARNWKLPAITCSVDEEGLYLDQPEEWDDPYRHFCWRSSGSAIIPDISDRCVAKRGSPFRRRAF